MVVIWFLFRFTNFFEEMDIAMLLYFLLRKLIGFCEFSILNGVTSCNLRRDEWFDSVQALNKRVLVIKLLNSVLYIYVFKI